MDNIIEPTIDYDFSKLYLGPPTSLAGGAYFTRIMYSTNKPLYIQTPKCLTKQGFIKSGKKIYTDLMFDNNDTVFINWIENLETKCQELIFSKGQNWFETKLEKEDIETAFTSPLKIFKSGKYYLLRVNVKPNIKIYDEKDQTIQTDDINADKHIISILEIQGIKFTNRNFQIEIELKQTMVVSPDPFLDECFIKKPIKKAIIEEKKEEKETNIESNELDELINNSAKELSEKMNPSIDLEVSFDKETIIEKPSENPLEELKEEIVLDIEELTNPIVVEDPNSLKEVDISSTLESNLETITLKKPNQVYYEIYKKAREKAKDAKKSAIVAYLEMKNIKKTYMLDDIDDSDSEFEDFENENLED
jgi:rRNA-processing protein FCF1